MELKILRKKLVVIEDQYVKEDKLAYQEQKKKKNNSYHNRRRFNARILSCGKVLRNPDYQPAEVNNDVSSRVQNESSTNLDEEIQKVHNLDEANQSTEMENDDIHAKDTVVEPTKLWCDRVEDVSEKCNMIHQPQESGGHDGADYKVDSGTKVHDIGGGDLSIDFGKGAGLSLDHPIEEYI
ncbi:hypothetical protein K7X08_023221 [Anisodus acutangulus]|uniref:Uncharacterized protein n=1 Tax=Anisodus acutangulus TaxID=402998 RepID=A0A9Q1R0V7_9SOLA|nr:hypothetical protein K7X08_023221 [Anisodus acutangulus]